MKRMFNVFVLLTCLCRGQQQPGGPQDHADVSIVVSTTFGEPLGKVLVILKAIGPRAEFSQLGNTIRFEQIPFGLYDLEIQASGFSTCRERVAIYQSQVHFWFGLFASPSHSEERSEVQGSLVPQAGNPKDLWARLVPRYSSNFIEDQIVAGKFNLTGINPGQYVLMVFNKEKLLLTKPVEYFGGILKLKIDLPN